MSSFDFFVHGFREGDTGVASALVEQFGVERDVAEVFVLSVPCVVVSAVPLNWLRPFRVALEQCGASVQIIESDRAACEPARVSPRFAPGVELQLPLPLSARDTARVDAPAGRIEVTHNQGLSRPLSREVTLTAGSHPDLRVDRDTVEQERPSFREPYSTDQFADSAPAARPHAPGLLPQPAPPAPVITRPAHIDPFEPALEDAARESHPMARRVTTEARVFAGEIAEARRIRAESGERERPRAHPLDDGASRPVASPERQRRPPGEGPPPRPVRRRKP